MERLSASGGGLKDASFGAAQLVDAVLASAEREGLLAGEGSSVGATLSARLVERAKAVTGIADETALLQYALASLAIEDPFFTAFVNSRGTVDPDLDFGI